ncbi:MAG: N-acetylmuramoyl-L-alanine amidase [Prevotellaceae bacterium]|jgi:N-acetylmuramoyl-L-alanine amidase|nr:N-acetylmuramoyl-L-alanine amidase [Prevotellaceae bacterium]
MENKFFTYFGNNMLYFTCSLTFFCIFTFPANAQKYINQQQIKKIVIDAGHGGKDPGAIVKKSKEKDITLAVALKLGEMISKNFPDVEVIYTRKKDVFVELNERVNIANRNHADLFISIHVDANKNTKARGTSTWIMGLHKSQANLEVSLRENAVITMEDDYSAKYEGFDPKSPESNIMFMLTQDSQMKESYKFAEIVQNEMVAQGPITGDRSVRQAGFLVLWKSAMPRILIELGFLTNPDEEQILIKDENQTKIAQNIFSSFCKYKKQYEENNTLKTSQTDSTEYPKVEENDNSPKSDNAGSVHGKNEEKTSPKDDTPSNKPVVEKTPTSLQKTYSVQIMAITKMISTTAKDFKGYKNIKYVKVGKYYKYITGNFTDLSEAKRFCQSLQKDFKGAFVVAVEENNLTPVR